MNEQQFSWPRFVCSSKLYKWNKIRLWQDFLRYSKTRCGEQVFLFSWHLFLRDFNPGRTYHTLSYIRANKTCHGRHFCAYFSFTFNSRSIVLSCPTAQCSAVLFFSSSQVTSAPLSSSSETTAEQPWAAAKSNGVHFSRSRGFKSTPCRENMVTVCYFIR